MLSPKKSLQAALLASAFGLALAATAASAQDYDRYGNRVYEDQSGETVIIHAPRYRPQVGDLGAPIQNVAMSRPVRFDDLDLRTAYGVRTLHNRIRYTARALCRDLDARYPVNDTDNWTCYRRAVSDAFNQADAAIDRAHYSD